MKFVSSKNVVIKVPSVAITGNGSIVFVNKDSKPILELDPNGDIFVNGSYVENDREIVGGYDNLLTRTSDVYT